MQVRDVRKTPWRVNGNPLYSCLESFWTEADRLQFLRVAKVGRDWSGLARTCEQPTLTTDLACSSDNFAVSDWTKLKHPYFKLNKEVIRLITFSILVAKLS